MSKKTKIVVVGAGAAGFFAAINYSIKNPESEVVILEKSNKVLAKVRVSGGGRCNVTHACFDNNLLVKNYPRGEKELKSVFSKFSVKDTLEWFESRGVKLKVEDDGRMFPVSDSSQSIIDCLMDEIKKHNIEIKLGFDVVDVEKTQEGFVLKSRQNEEIICDKLIITAGGNPKTEAYNWIKKLGHSIVNPVPSLFTFNVPNSKVTELMGVSVPSVGIRINNTKLKNQGPILITHWGFSGPAVLKLSAFGAEELNKQDYNFTISINWINKNENELRVIFSTLRSNFSTEKMARLKYFQLPQRLWEYLLQKANIDFNKTVSDLSKTEINKLIQLLSSDEYQVKGKTTFKEEFVTCGGVDLREIDFKTMQSKKTEGLYFAGEVVNIDAVTGGFNFQAAWSTSFLASQSI